jgi:hypothetical protein
MALPQGEIRYLNSEMSANELVARLGCFGMAAMEHIKKTVKFISRRKDFEGAIDPDGINFIDYLESHEDFFLTGSLVNAIHGKLKTGIAIVAVQKKQGEENPKGGQMVMEKPRLVVNLDSNAPYGLIAKLKKVKEPKDYRHNPQGIEIDYQLTAAMEYERRTPWRYISNIKEREKINAVYKSRFVAKDFGESKEEKFMDQF